VLTLARDVARFVSLISKKYIYIQLVMIITFEISGMRAGKNEHARIALDGKKGVL